MIWWIWMVVGLVLLLLEALTPGALFFLFFAVAAMWVGLIELAGADLPLSGELLAFSVLSVASLLALRGRLARRLQSSAVLPRIDDLTNETAIALQPLAPGEWGRVELRGTTWRAVNDGATAVIERDRCMIASVDGVSLRIIAEREAKSMSL